MGRIRKFRSLKLSRFTRLQIIVTMRSLFFVLSLSIACGLSSALKAGECEVCVKTLERFSATLTKDQLTKPKDIEDGFRTFCKDLKGKENRFCYFLGGTADAATGILGEMSKPMSWGMPALKVCEKLKKKDRQVCELAYDKQIDFKSVDLKKLKVRDLKKILSDWEETCDGCLEKGDYIKRINEVKPKHVRDEL